jgi:hypothetical protein
LHRLLSSLILRSLLTHIPACTFLGPSRKRGPPKGYIDAIEARLHQTEALLGILTATSDERAQSLLRDLSKDPLAREIIKRVDRSPYGSKTNKQAAAGGASKPRSAQNSESDHDVQPKIEGDQLDLRSTHPSNEWQSHVVALLEHSPTHREPDSRPSSSDQAPPQYGYTLQGQQPLYVVPTTSDGDDGSPTRRQRRRVGGDEFSASQDSYGYQPQPPTISDGLGHGAIVSHRSLNSSSPSSAGCVIAKDERGQRRSTSPQDSASAESDPEVADAVGQLSLNEDEQVRYHGKASGLHLLGVTDRVDTRNEGGIWQVLYCFQRSTCSRLNRQAVPKTRCLAAAMLEWDRRLDNGRHPRQRCGTTARSCRTGLSSQPLFRIRAPTVPDFAQRHLLRSSQGDTFVR